MVSFCRFLLLTMVNVSSWLQSVFLKCILKSPDVAVSSDVTSADVGHPVVCNTGIIAYPGLEPGSEPSSPDASSVTNGTN